MNLCCSCFNLKKSGSLHIIALMITFVFHSDEIKSTVNVLTGVLCSLRTSATVVSRWKLSLEPGKCYLSALTLCCLLFKKIPVKNNVGEQSRENLKMVSFRLLPSPHLDGANLLFVKHSCVWEEPLGASSSSETNGWCKRPDRRSPGLCFPLCH